MKTFLLVLLLLVVSSVQAQSIMRADSAVYRPGTTWDSVYVGGPGGARKNVWIGVANLLGNSVMAVAIGNDTAANLHKRLYVYPGDTRWFPPLNASFIRRRAVSGDTCIAQTTIISEPQIR